MDFDIRESDRRAAEDYPRSRAALRDPALFDEYCRQTAWALVSHEKPSRRVWPHLWEQAVAESDGDVQAARSRYFELGMQSTQHYTARRVSRDVFAEESVYESARAYQEKAASRERKAQGLPEREGSKRFQSVAFVIIIMVAITLCGSILRSTEVPQFWQESRQGK